ncbi:MAG: hypothetical protein Q8K30_06170 [Candidatus Gracilibacteria bacterium]|nr:hypothetical protein [Candidatus Gracilibacteria bacterium]
MRKVILFLIFLIIIFIVNIGFYFLSEDYRDFLKELKGVDNSLKLEEKSFSDSLMDEKIVLQNEKKDNNSEINNTKKLIDKNNNQENNGSKVKQSEVLLGKNYLDILELFSSYSINKLHVNSYLFDITDEYPDNYYEYYSKDLTLYLFPTKTYKEVFDIFSVLSTELPFKINEVNNFGEKSFYINLNKDISDRFIRMLISDKGIVFGVKVEKTQYDIVKQKLDSLKSE